MEMITFAGILVILGCYGWYMHRQGKTAGFIRGAICGGSVVLSQLIHEKTLTRTQAKQILPALNNELIDHFIEQIKDATVQSQKHRN
jgi:hypothetical protein